MKKTFKLVGIFMLIVLIASVGGLAGYALVVNNQTYYIYNVAFVEPKGVGYIYTDESNEYKPMHDQIVYMNSISENYLRIAVLATSSNNTKNITIKSSDTSVAEIVYRNGACYAHYLNAGVTTITSSLADVSDSFKLYVYNSTPDDFIVFDYSYYGNEKTSIDGEDYYKFASKFPNQIVCYADGKSYNYDYKVYDENGKEVSDINKSSFEIAYYDEEIFSEAKINGKDKLLQLTCKDNVVSDSTNIIIQSYYLSDGKNKKIQKQFIVSVKIVIYEVEFIEAVISDTPDFVNNYVYINMPDISDEEAINDSTKVEKLLDLRREKSLIKKENSIPVFKAYFTSDVKKLYLKFRIIYTNGDVVYLTKSNSSDSENKIFDMIFSDNSFNEENDTDYLRRDPSGEFYELEMTTKTNCKITIDLDSSIKKDTRLTTYNSFEFTLEDLISSNVNKFYSYEDGNFTYIYWDERTRFHEVYDANGNIIELYDKNLNKVLIGE